MIVLIGGSGSGKSSIENNLVKKHGYNKIISYTTRKPREGEVEGVDYHYITEEKFKQLKENNFFAESAQYNDWDYGVAKEDCTDDKVVVLSPHGLRQISKIKDINVISFYIDVPRRDRLIQSLRRGDNIEEAYRRSLSDIGQFDGIMDEVTHVISNPGYTYSVDKMSALILDYIDLINKIAATYRYRYDIGMDAGGNAYDEKRE